MLTSEQKRALRPYRIAAWALYFVVAVGFSSMVTYSVARAALDGTPPTAPAGPCRDVAHRLFSELEAWRGRVIEPSHREQAFTEFRKGWEARFRGAREQCKEEAKLFDALGEVFTEYAIDVGRYSRGAGPAVDAFKRL